jgi:hypothetical protein
MKNEFVPYNEAVELKELGFDEECFRYGDSDSSYIDTPSSIEERMINPFNKTIKIPTFSQVFRWFRGKHDLHSCVAPVYEDEISKVIVYWFWIQGFDSFEDEDINYKTPEEAELACLQKLIQIVKK